MHRAIPLLLICTLMLIAGAQFVVAQGTVTVPDLTGLNVPQAAAALNRAGLKMGTEENVAWTAESGQERNRVGGQSVAPGTSVEQGAVIDITVLRAPNAALIYDDNDLTLVNLGGGNININNLSFNAVDGSGASFAASRWANNLRGNQCLQIWSVGRNGPKGLDECPLIQRWIVTTNTNEHFWTGSGGTTAFNVMQGGVERAVCPIANPGRCEFFLPGGARTGAVTPYVYFAYTPDRLAIINNSEDRWMAIGNLVVRNEFAQPRGAAVNVGQPATFGSPDTLGEINRLAPGQCLLFTNSSPTAEQAPEECDIVARLDIAPSLIFWGANFPVESISDDTARSCPAATEGHLTLCVLPR